MPSEFSPSLYFLLLGLKEVFADLLIISWADGWRGFIDGAFEMGRVAAWRILREDKGKRQTSKL